MITIACILKTGGDFSAEHVYVLFKQVSDHLAIPFRFRCLTDDKRVLDTTLGDPLLHNFPGWWSKMELFSIPGPLIYFDLDTVIIGDLDSLAEDVKDLKLSELMMLRRFRHPGWASGIMGWQGDWSWVLRRFITELSFGHAFVVTPKGFRLDNGGAQFIGDQNWIARALMPVWPIVAAQDMIRGIYSYRHHIRSRKGGMPDDARIICFHGHPRPWELDLDLSALRGNPEKGRAR